MKRHKRRMDARLKPFIWGRIEAIAAKMEATYTEVIEEALEKGLNWQIKKIRKELDPEFLLGDPTPVQIQSTGSLDEYQKNQLTEEEKKNIEIAKYNWLEEENK